MTITALYVIKNEAEFIERSVATVLPYVEEVVLFDTGSSDGTVEISRRMAAKNPIIRLVQHPVDFDRGCEYATRNIALSHCTSDWVLALDADQLLSDKWRDLVPVFLEDPSCECIGVEYEHLVGSYEYVHTKACGVPDTTWIFFRRTPHLQWRPAAEVCPWARLEHHASAERSCRPGSLRVCKGVTCFHYGFTKRDMMGMAIYRVGRGDSGHEPEKKQELVQQLQNSGNPFLFCGPVERVSYGKEHVPSVMREAFDTTYRLELGEGGRITKRVEL